MRRRDSSWLLERQPPAGRVTGELALWWAVIRQAALDLRFSYPGRAIDALEFLRDVGPWLAGTLYSVPEIAYRQEVASLLYRRNRAFGQDLDLRELGVANPI